MEKKNDNFIMLPTVDICFKNLMENPEVRRGFIAALLKVQPEEIEESTLLPTTLQRDYGDDKLGILDILVQLEDGTQIDMEIQVLELKKLPGKVKGEEDIISWMRFLGGKTRREFEAMAKTDAYINEAYKELEKLSADERAKLEYEAREKAIRDHNALVNSAIRQGLRQGIEQEIEQGIEQGRKQGIEQGIEQCREEEKKLLIRKMLENGAEPELISRLTGLSPDIIKSVETSVNNEI